MLMKANLLKKGIIFDFDDTIANTRPGKDVALKIISAKIRDYLKKEKINLNLNKLSRTIRKVEEEMDAKRIYDRNMWWSFVLRKFSEKKSLKIFLNSLTKEYWKTVIEKSRLYKDTIPTLSYLKNKGYTLGLLTDTDGLKGEKLKRIRLLDLEKWFNSIIISGEHTKEVKPDPTPFYLISKEINLKPTECVYVGNNPISDIQGAKKADMMAILMKRGNSRIKVKPSLIVRELSALKKIF